MRLPTLVLACLGLATAGGGGSDLRAVTAEPVCLSRAAIVEGHGVAWHRARTTDAAQLDQWCRAVGAPIFVAAPAPPDGSPPLLKDLVVVTWNAHLAEGRLSELIGGLRSGTFTSGQPVRHFVLLIQETYRRGPEVPLFARDARTAFGIVPRDPHAPDAGALAASLGLSMWYVPSMRNGREFREDRGNAIFSTEPLSEPRALELPLERQRRVAIGAAVQVRTERGIEKLALLDAHLEPLSAPRSLWLFRNPRESQGRAILKLVAEPQFSAAAGVVIGGDFNTIRRDEEPVYDHARQWATSLTTEDKRPTHIMGRLDYLFFRLAGNWTAISRRLDTRFGSDHYPVLGHFVPPR